ncbi:hypothetical protein CC2G_007821 [Coprinopsis cinerea AmutBmut pab1-1]|nr:hypothetical protein CC2G_007821 [Coprinopsis cinerea AmutBmut pab1-1]
MNVIVPGESWPSPPSTATGDDQPPFHHLLDRPDDDQRIEGVVWPSISTPMQYVLNMSVPDQIRSHLLAQNWQNPIDQIIPPLGGC